MRGDGRIFPKAGSRFWWMAYYVDGTEVRESTGETDERRARAALRRKMADVLRGEAIPREGRLTFGEMLDGVETDHRVNGRASLATLPYPRRHLLDHFGAHAKAASITTDGIQRYVVARQAEGAATATINNELALLGRGFTLAVRARRLRTRPYVPRLAADPSRVRKGFFTREQVVKLATHLPPVLGDVVLFLFFSAWRVGEVRTLQWRDYDRHDQAIRLRPEHSKTRHARVLPVAGELAAVIERRLQARRLDCPYIFHRGGRPVGDFRKAWTKACQKAGVAGRIVHDLRRSGVKHLIETPGNDPHTVMAFSGHRTNSMLRRYHIIDLDDLRRAAERAAAYAGAPASVVPLRTENTDRTRTVAGPDGAAAPVGAC
jgi:integrase